MPWTARKPGFSGTEAGLSPCFEDIVDLFRNDRYGLSSAIDLGAGVGTTTAALAVNFRQVLATDVFWDIQDPVEQRDRPGLEVNMSKGERFHLNVSCLAKNDIYIYIYRL